MIQKLLKRRMFDGARLFGHWYVLIVDGTVQEKCRQGFEADGKISSGDARFRYVLQVMIQGHDGHLLPFMHESMDMHNPLSEKEDCELKAFMLIWPLLKVDWIHCFCAERCQVLSGRVSVLYDFLGRLDINWRGFSSELSRRVFKQNHIGSERHPVSAPL